MNRVDHAILPGHGRAGQPLSLSLIVAVYREGERLRETADRLRTYASQRGAPWELVFVIDGGAPETRAVLEQLSAGDPHVRVIALDRNRGQGAAVKAGMLAAQGALLAYLDADLAAAPAQLDALERAISEEGYDAAIGSRWMQGADVQQAQPSLRRWLGRTYYALVRRVFGLSYADTNCGLKMYRRETAHALFGFSRCWRWCFNAEHLLLAKRFGLRVKEVPIAWAHRPVSTVRLGRDIAFTLWEVALTAVRLRMGIYPKVQWLSRPTGEPASTLAADETASWQVRA